MKFTHINLLEELARPELSELLSAFHEKSFPRHAIIFEPHHTFEASGQHTSLINVDRPAPAEDSPAKSDNYVFIVRTGRVRVYLSCGDKVFTIGVLQPGDIYVSHSNAFVQALEDCQVLMIDTLTFNKRMMAIPQFTVSIVRVLGGILKNTFSIIDGLALRDTTGRLARYLLEAAGQNSADQGLIQLNISGELLAQALGASRQTISTLLTDFTRSGILHKEKRGVYRILDEDRLKELLM